MEEQQDMRVDVSSPMMQVIMEALELKSRETEWQRDCILAQMRVDEALAEFSKIDRVDPDEVDAIAKRMSDELKNADHLKSREQGIRKATLEFLLRNGVVIFEKK